MPPFTFTFTFQRPITGNRQPRRASHLRRLTVPKESRAHIALTGMHKYTPALLGSGGIRLTTYRVRFRTSLPRATTSLLHSSPRSCRSSQASNITRPRFRPPLSVISTASPATSLPLSTNDGRELPLFIALRNLLNLRSSANRAHRLDPTLSGTSIVRTPKACLSHFTTALFASCDNSPFPFHSSGYSPDHRTSTRTAPLRDLRVPGEVVWDRMSGFTGLTTDLPGGFSTWF